MITGFNTDVRFRGRVYHVQTEDRGGSENPVLESLVYVGGTVIAKKLTPYAEHLRNGATEDMIASLLRKQHQVMIAAVKAGRIGSSEEQKEIAATAPGPEPARPFDQPATPPAKRAGSTSPPALTPKKDETPGLSRPIPAKPPAQSNSSTAQSGGLNLDQVISDYLKRTSEQGRLELKVLTPSSFVSGKTIGLRVQVAHNGKPDIDSVVTVKIIGTAFKPQVFIGRAAGDGIASFSLALPAFTAGTAAIVIEAQSQRGRGELKHLIRRG